MGRPPVFAENDILDTAARMLAADGPSALKVASVAAELGAPSGSLYHRFSSRDEMAAALWVRTVTRFQNDWVAAVEAADDSDVVHVGAQFVLDWCREHLVEAQVLLLYRSSDLVDDERWPDALRQHVAHQQALVETVIDEICCDLGASTEQQRRRVTFALMDIPLGAVRRALARGVAPSAEVDPIVRDAVAGVLAGIDTDR